MSIAGTLAFRGKRFNEIALILGIAYATVKTNLDQVRRKLNCMTMPQATAAAVALGILTDDDLTG